MTRLAVHLQINGSPWDLDVEPTETLLDVLRDRLGLTGTNRGCNQGDCGCCTILLDGKAVNSCLVLAADADGTEATTIEGLASPERLHPVQQAFVDHGAIQCGYCTPGMVMTAVAFLAENTDPTASQVRKAMEANLCRCTGYEKIVEAVMSAARAIGGGSAGSAGAAESDRQEGKP